MSEAVYSPSYDSPEPEAPRTSYHKWNHFEVRTLVCLIIKGEHKVSKDPMDMTDKLNRALNPGSSRSKPAYTRDIPHEEVQKMLRRILSKKLHAVDLAERNYQTPVTRAKVNAFMRNLGFDGSEEEWKLGRKEEVKVENEQKLLRFMIRKEGGRPSPRSRDERHRRRMLLREPRAKRLLRGWSIGASFWEGMYFYNASLKTQTDFSSGPNGENRSRGRENGRGSTASSATVVNPDNIPYITDKAPSQPAQYFTPNTPNTAVAMWGGGFGHFAAATPKTSAIVPPSMSLAPVLDYESYGNTYQL